MNKPVPSFQYPSTRLIGVELEIDPGQPTDAEIAPVAGWTSHGDGSLSGYGSELVIYPPVRLNQARSLIEAQCATLKNINVKSRGGFHVHVQVKTESLDDIWNLTLWYHAAQQCIDRWLVGSSRVDNRFSKPYDGRSKASWIELFRLEEPANGRVSAKGSRQYWCVNPAMFRCQTARDRSIEFRQGSISKRWFVVYGWACFMTALVDLAARKPAPLAPISWETLKAEIAEQTEIAGGHGVAEWLEWRKDYLHGQPSPEMLAKLKSAVVSSKIGMYGVSRKLDVSLPYAKKLLEVACEQGIISRCGDHTYRIGYESMAEDDLAQLEVDALQMELQPPIMPALPEVVNA